MVDDDPDFLEAIRTGARDHLVEVVTASDARSAIVAAEEREIDAAIVDVALATGETAGFNLLAQLRERGDLALAAMSVTDTMQRRLQAIHAGASRFLPKPLSADAFAIEARELAAERRGTRPTVLVIDDDPDFTAHVAAVLGDEGVRVEARHATDNALDHVRKVQPDMLLLDVFMPGLGGFDLCRIVRASSELSQLPVLLVTAQSSAESRLAAFEAGADDFVSKPIVPRELVARVMLRLERTRMLRERHERDALTGLLTRRPFTTHFNLRMAEHRRNGRPLSIVLLDIDRFKQINDERGHLVGDAVLAGLGRFLDSRFRNSDLRCRWGGEEFVLVFFGEGTAMGTSLADRALREFAELSFDDEAGNTFNVTFSGGVASFPDDGGDLASLIRVADARLYAAKGKGRARIESGEEQS